MSLMLIFWILMLLWLVYGAAYYWGSVPGPYGPWGHGLFLFILLLILGWAVFGAPVKGGGQVQGLLSSTSERGVT